VGKNSRVGKNAPILFLLISYKWGYTKQIQNCQVSVLRKMWNDLDTRRIRNFFETYKVQEKAYVEYENDRIMQENVKRKKRHKPLIEYLNLTSDEEIMANIDTIEPSLIDSIIKEDLRFRKKNYNWRQKWKEYKEMCVLYKEETKRVSFAARARRRRQSIKEMPKKPFFRALVTPKEMLQLISIGIERTKELHASLCISTVNATKKKPSIRPFFLIIQDGATEIEDGRVVRANGRQLAHSYSLSGLTLANRAFNSASQKPLRKPTK
jgi:hypothetical protein